MHACHHLFGFPYACAEKVVRVTTLPPPAPVLTTAATTAVVAATSPATRLAQRRALSPTWKASGMKHRLLEGIVAWYFRQLGFPDRLILTVFQGPG